MLFLQSIIQVIVGAAMLRVLPPGTVLHSPRGVPHFFEGMDSDLDGNVQVRLQTGWLTNSPKTFPPQEVSIKVVTTTWTIKAPLAASTVSL